MAGQHGSDENMSNLLTRRVERLEHAIGRPAEEVPPMEITNFIAPDGEVTDSFVITIPQPAYRLWRGNAKWPGWKRDGAAGR